MTKLIKEMYYGEHKLVLETGEIARQATASVCVSMGGTVVLVTVVGKQEADESRDFFPLTVNYQEKTYAAGKIPGGFLKREGRPSEIETLTSRLIDRPIRPLFPEGFQNEVQVVATVMSLNPAVSPDVLAMIGASAALSISGIPFQGPIGAARVGYKDGVYLLNPSPEQLKESQLNLMVAGTKKAILMVESEAKELSEEVMLGAVLYGHEMMQAVIDLINEMAVEVNAAPWNWQAPAKDEALTARIHEAANEKVKAAYDIRDKQQRYDALSEMRNDVISHLLEENEEVDESKARDALSKLEKDTVRGRILEGQARIDGRDNHSVRPISIRTSFLPRTHGSALFTRGETQAIVVATLGNERDAQIIDALQGEYNERFMLHYNFPPYCVGETGMMGSPKRREIGHGHLAKRAIAAVLPSADQCPYVLRVVSEITESNGSSSMATVCGTSLALMDAGIAIKAPVAGVAMGLIKEGEQYAVLTDILGDEDHLGDMDFKVAGTRAGVTALQMDIKIDGITKEIMHQALEQALQGRMHILDVMESSMSSHREEMSDFAPRVEMIKIHPDKIRDVIGKGGVTIRGITEETGVSIDINDNGEVKLFCPDLEAMDAAKKLIKSAIAGIEPGTTYHGKVSKIVDFGAFISLTRDKDGLLHISQITKDRSQKVTEVLKEGQEISVLVTDVDQQGRVKLKWLDKPESQEKAAAEEPKTKPREEKEDGANSDNDTVEEKTVSPDTQADG